MLLRQHITITPMAINQVEGKDPDPCRGDM
jgi:hypothetical protein